MFLTRWYGPPAAEPVDDPAAHHLPPALRDWYRTTRRWQTNIIHDRVFLEPEQIREFEGMQLFLTDSEGDCLWTFDPETDGNPVHFWDPLTESWSLTEATLQRFLLVTAAAEVAMYAPHFRCSWTASESQASQTLAALTEVPHSPMPWPTRGSRLYVGPDTLAIVAPGDGEIPATPETFAVILASHSEQALDVAGLPDGDDWLRRPTPPGSGRPEGSHHLNNQDQPLI